MAVDFFLKLGTIPGESKDHLLKEHIQLESWSWGETQTGTMGFGGGGGAGKVSMQDFHFVMKMNKASPELFINCATGTHIGDATLTCRRAGKTPQTFLKVTFTNCLVSSYQTGGSAAHPDVPHDAISLNYEEIKMEYSEQKHDGTMNTPVTHAYNLKESKFT